MLVKKKELTRLIQEAVMRAMEEGKFDPTTLDAKGFQSLGAAIEYVKNKVGLRFLGKGSSRIVFVIDSKRALKMAIDEKGIAQNEAELQIVTDPAGAVVAKILQYDPNFKWLISELVRPLEQEEEFAQLTGVTWEIFSFLLASPARWKDRLALIPKIKPKVDISTVEKNPFVNSVMNSFPKLKSKLESGDLTRLNHWGKTPDQRVVLLDYGFTTEVADKHYE